jgi:hypothetical protein
VEIKEMSSERTPKVGAVCHFSFNYCDYWFRSAKQKGEKEMSSERESLKGGKHVILRLSQLLSPILPVGSTDEWC